MKKSLLITSYFPPLTGGISKSLYNFSKKFNPSEIVILTDKKFIGRENFKIETKSFFWSVWPNWVPLIFKTFASILTNNIRIIQVGQVIPIGYVAFLMKKFINITYIVYIYGQDLIITRDLARKNKMLIKVLNNSNGIIANSQFTKKLAIKMGVKNAISIAYPCPQKDIKDYSEEELKNFLNKNNITNKKIILTVGNLVKRKGHDIVLKSLKRLVKKRKDFVYLIVGNGPNNNNLKELVNKYKLTQFVKFFEDVNDNELGLFYASCDLFIMPSRIIKNSSGQPIDVEGFGMVFLEANLYGKPVIGGDNGGQSDAIINNKTGFLVDSLNDLDIFTKIDILFNNPKKSSELGQAGRNRVINEFTWEKQTRVIIDLLKKLG